jgi:hypothetical protein
MPTTPPLPARRTRRPLSSLAPLAGTALLLGALALAPDAQPAAAGEAPAGDAPATADEVAADLRAADAAVRAAACDAAVRVPGDIVLKALVRCLEDVTIEVRQGAIRALGARTVPAEARKASSGLLARLARKGVPEDERLRLLRALHDLARPEAVRPLLAAIDRDMPDDEVAARLLAVANVPTDEAIERLVQFLDRGHRAESRADRDAAMRALRYATGQRFGREADAWRAWWREVENGYDHAAAAARRHEAGHPDAGSGRPAKGRKRGAGRPDGESPGEAPGEAPGPDPPGDDAPRSEDA